jgi:ribose 5-phosphate isomerase A
MNNKVYDPKEVVSNYALQYIKNNKIIGIGTGKTVRKLIELIIKNNMINDKLYVTSSIDSDIEISKNGGIVISLYNGNIPDIYIDSFDYLIPVNHSYVMIKGGGGALLREKLLAYFANKKVFIGEISKIKKSFPIKIPIEIVPVSLSYISNKLKELNYNAEIREGNGKIGPIISDNGNIIVDITINSYTDLCELDSKLKDIPGIIETGIFCDKLYDEIIIGNENGRLEIIKKSRNGN